MRLLHIILDTEFSTSLPPLNQTVSQGDNVTFYCILNSKGPSNIMWLKDGRPLNTGGLLLLQPHPQGMEEVLSLRSVNVHDAGDYSCVGNGQEFKATLSIIGKDNVWMCVLDLSLHLDLLSLCLFKV